MSAVAGAGDGARARARVGFAAVLSDLDGVLVDSTAAVERIWRAWLTRAGLPADTLDGRMHGRPSAAVIAELAPERDQAAEGAWFLAQEMADLDGNAALPGAAELLADADPLAVVTDAPAGIAAGKAAGMTVFAVTTTHAPAELAQADDLAPTLRELLPRLLSSR